MCYELLRIRIALSNGMSFIFIFNVYGRIPMSNADALVNRGYYSLKSFLMRFSIVNIQVFLLIFGINNTRKIAQERNNF